MHELTERIRFYLVPSPKELDEADKWIRRYLSEKAKIIKDMHNHYEGHFDQDKKVLEILGLSPSELGESQTAHRCACGAEHLDKPKEVGEKVDSIMVGCYCDQCAGKQEIKGFHTFVPKPKAEARGRLAGLEEVAKIIDTAIKEAHRVITTCRSNGSETHLDRWHERLICLEGLANAIRQRSSK